MWVPKGLGMIRHLTNGSAWALTKGVASCDMLRVGARGLRSGDTRMGLPTTGHTVVLPYGRRNPPNVSIPVGGGRETKMGFPDERVARLEHFQPNPYGKLLGDVVL